MAEINVFKLKHKQPDGSIKESRTYYFYENRKRVNTHLSNRKDAISFVDKRRAEAEAKKEAERELILEENEGRYRLVDKIQSEGWVAFDANGKCLYEKNPKYIIAQGSENLHYGVQQSKMVASCLNRALILTNDELGNIPYNKVSKADALAFRQRLAASEFPNSTRNETLKALRAIYTFWSGTDETITFNPFRKSKTMADFQVKKDTRDIFSEAELRTIFDKDMMKRLFPKDKEWLEFLESDYYKSFFFTALTGLRSAEVRCLIPSQITNERILTVNRAFKQKNTRKDSIDLPKAMKERVVLICDTAHKIIKDKLPYIKETDYIFKNQKGNNAMEASRWNKKFNYFMEMLQKKYPKVFGGKRYTPHCFRKTLNTILINKYYCSPELVIDFLGWGENMTKTAQTKVQKKHYSFTKAEHLVVVAQYIEKMISGREMLWMMLDKEYESNTDLELKRMNMMIMAGTENE